MPSFACRLALGSSRQSNPLINAGLLALCIVLGIIPGGALFIIVLLSESQLMTLADRLDVWRSLPVSETDIGRALWFMLLGIPLLLSTMGASLGATFFYPWKSLMWYGISFILIFNVIGLRTLLNTWPLRCGKTVSKIINTKAAIILLVFMLAGGEIGCILSGVTFTYEVNEAGKTYTDYIIDNAVNVFVGFSSFVVSVVALYVYSCVPPRYQAYLRRNSVRSLHIRHLIRRTLLTLQSAKITNGQTFFLFVALS